MVEFSDLLPLLAQQQRSFWSSPGGGKLLALIVALGAAAVGGAISWIVVGLHRRRLWDDYVRAMQTQPPGGPLPSPAEWLQQDGWRRFREEVEPQRGQRACRECVFADFERQIECPRAFHCGVLDHPRASGKYILRRSLVIGLKCIGLSVFIVAVYPLYCLISPPPVANNPRPWSEAIPWIVVGVGGLALLYGAAAAGFNYFEARSIRRQVRQAAKAARALGLEFLHYHPLRPQTAMAAFPMIFPGVMRELHVAMFGNLNGEQIVVAYFGLDISESDYTKDGVERKMAQTREVLGHGATLEYGHFVAMFPEPLNGVPDFAMAPVSDKNYHLTRFAPAISLSRQLGSSLSDRFQLVGDPRHETATSCVQNLMPLFDGAPDWHVQVQLGRLMAWRGTMGGTETIVPGDDKQIVADLQFAVKLRKALSQSLCN